MNIKKTMTPTYESYPTKQEAAARLQVLAEELKSKGYAEELREVLFQFPVKEAYVFDKAKWHYEGEFPAELDKAQAYVPTGMFITWAIKNDLISKKSRKRDAADIERVKNDEMSGAEFYRRNWDGVFSSRELGEEGDDFAREYLHIHDDLYTAVDFMNVLAAGLPTIYHVPDTFESYYRIEPIINERYQDWRSRQASKATSNVLPEEEEHDEHY